MSTPPAARPKDACPHCGGTTGMSLWALFPSRDNNRRLTCKSCGRSYDVSNNSKMASVLAGMLGMAAGTMGPFVWILKAGHGSKLSVVGGIATVMLCIGFAAVAAGRLTLSLVKK